MFDAGRSKGSTIFLGMTLLLACVVFSNDVHSVQSTPADTFVVPCKIDTYGEAWDGTLAYGLFEYNSTNTSQTADSYLVVMRTNGELLYLRKYNDSSGDYGIVKYISNDTLMFKGEPGQTTHFWNLTTNQTTDFPSVTAYHHDIEYNPITGTFLALRNYVREVNGTKVLFDTIVELNATGEVLWTWDTYDHLDLSEACPFNDTWPINGETVMDFTHCNAIQWDYNESIVYLNVRNLNTFYKINMTTGEVIWGIGEHGNFTLLDADGRRVSSLWYHSHAVREVESDVFIMFDNDYHNQTDPNDAHSRILEVTLNEQNMTAQESWSWTAPKEYWSTYWGKADRLPNGDRIGTFGTQNKQFANGMGAILVEVNPSGEIVRTYTFPSGWGIYRIEETASLSIQNNNDWGLTYPLIAFSIVAVALVTNIYLLKIKKNRNTENHPRVV